MRHLVAICTYSGDLITMPLPGLGADLYEAMDALGEGGRQGRKAVGGMADEDPRVSLLHHRCAVRVGDPARIGGGLSDEEVPTLIVTVLPHLGDLVALFYSWRTLMNASGTLAMITPAGGTSRLGELIVPVARTAGFTLIGQHVTGHCAVLARDPRTPAGRALPRPGLLLLGGGLP